MAVEVTFQEPPSGHSLLVCVSDEQTSATLTAWAATGLRGGEKVLCAGMSTAASTDLLDRLREPRQGIDLHHALAAGQLRLGPVEEFYPADVQEAVVVAALGEGYDGVRMTAPADRAMTRMAAAEYDAAEAAMDALCNRYPLSALCRYDARVLRANLGLAVAHHPTVADAIATLSLADGAGSGRPAEPSAPVRLSLVGELDSSNSDVLGQLVGRAASRAADGSLTVDLVQVTFLSVGGVRALLRATERLRSRGGAVRVIGASRPVARVMRLLDVEQVPGVVLEDGPT